MQSLYQQAFTLSEMQRGPKLSKKVHITVENEQLLLARHKLLNAQVAAAMSEQWREQQSVSALKKQLVQLQSKVSDAHNRLHYTQASTALPLQASTSPEHSLPSTFSITFVHCRAVCIGKCQTAAILYLRTLRLERISLPLSKLCWMSHLRAFPAGSGAAQHQSHTAAHRA